MLLCDFKHIFNIYIVILLEKEKFKPTKLIKINNFISINLIIW